MTATIIGICLSLALLGWSAASRADDSSPGVMLSGLQAEPSGSVRAARSSVKLQAGHVTLTIGLRMVDAGSTLRITGPRFGWLGEAEPYPDRQFPELNATIDGAAAHPDIGARAFAGNAEVTEAVVQAGLDPFAVVQTPPVVDPPTNTGGEAFDHLLKTHAVERQDGHFLAGWDVQRSFGFNVRTRRQATLSLSWMARPGFRLLPMARLPEAVTLDA